MAAPPVFTWSLRDEFLNREQELAQLEEWWNDPADRLIVNLHGRRRVGKSWLLRAFAHGKPAIVLVAEQIARGAQLNRFAERLTPTLGNRPDIADVPDLFRLLYGLGEQDKCLVVVDEFPYLLPSRAAARHQLLTAVQADLEDLLDVSKVKLMLCGSHVAQMESLLAAASPLRGRMRAMRVRPLSFHRATPFLGGFGAEQAITRYAIAGGMPRYLRLFGQDRPLSTLISTHVLDSTGSLFNEPREILEQELSKPNVHFSVLETLADGAKPLDEIASKIRETSAALSRYVDTLQAFGIIERRVPVTKDKAFRGGHYELRDPFFRFWFRFNFPFQDSLEDGGLRGGDLYKSTVEPQLPDHVAAPFEELCRLWTLRTFGVGGLTKVGSWWGNAADELRKTGVRSSEEIDVVGLRGRKVVGLVGECKWTNGKLGLDVLTDLEKYKLPALRQDARVAKDLQIVLFSKAGFSSRLEQVAAERDDLLLVALRDIAALAEDGV